MNLDINLLKEKLYKEKFIQLDNILYNSEKLKRLAFDLGSGRTWNNLSIPGRKIINEDIIEIKTTHEKSSAGVGLIWHSDGTYENEVPLGNILHITQAPSKGGSTQFVDTTEVLNRLPNSLYNDIKNLYSIHDQYKSWKLFRNSERYKIIVGNNSLKNEVIHPIIYKHPITNNEILFVNKLMTKKIINVSETESIKLLKILFNYLYDEKYIKSLRANNNSILIWDNIGTQHRAIHDYFPETRIGYRISFY